MASQKPHNRVPEADQLDELSPIPTLIKERLSLTSLRPKLGEKLKALEGQEIIAVTISASESKAIVREQYLYELINLCNTLMYDRLKYEGRAVPTKEERQDRLERELEGIEGIFTKAKGD